MTVSLMRSDLAGESVVEEGSVIGFIRTVLELEAEMSGRLLLLWALSVSWYSFLVNRKTMVTLIFSPENPSVRKVLSPRYHPLAQCWGCAIPTHFFATKQECDIAFHHTTSGMGTFWEGEVWSHSIP